MQDGLKDTATGIRGDKKRKLPIMVEPADQQKKSKPSPAGPGTPAPHDALLAELSTKYDVLPAFTISSTKIQKRVTWLLLHLRKNDGDARKRAVLLYARPGEVGKMITISEQVKRIVAEEDGGGRWYQYNKTYELPPRPEVVEETMLGGGAGADGDTDGDDNDDFEVMESRFEKAVMPQPKKRIPRSLSIFLSLEPMPELKAQEGVTQQTNETQGGQTAATDA